MKTITLSNDEVSTLVAIMHSMTAGVSSVGLREARLAHSIMGIDLGLSRTVDGIAFDRPDQWRITEISAGETNNFAFDGDEEAFRRDLVLCKMVTR